MIRFQLGPVSDESSEPALIIFYDNVTLRCILCVNKMNHSIVGHGSSSTNCRHFHALRFRRVNRETRHIDEEGSLLAAGPGGMAVCRNQSFRYHSVYSNAHGKNISAGL